MTSNNKFLLLLTIFSFNSFALTVNPQVDGLIQLWGIYNNPAANAQSNNAENEFRRGFLVRRTQIKLQEERSDKLRWEIKFDLARNFHDGSKQTTTERTKMLLDMFVDYKFSNEFKIRIGQFKEVTALEGLDSSAELFFSERAYGSRYLGNQRDKGIMLTHTHEFLQVDLALLNGEGINQPTGSSMRKINANISYNHEGKNIGVWVLQKAKSETDDTDPEDASLGFYARVPLGKITLQAEFFNQNKNDKAQGQYIMAKYSLNDRDTVAIRLDSFKDQPKDNQQTAVDLGFTRSLETDTSLRTDIRLGTEESTDDKRDIQELIVQLQLKF